LWIATLVFTLSATRQGGITDGKVDGLSKQITDVNAAVVQLRSSLKPDDAAARDIITGFPSKIDQIHSEISEVRKAQSPVPVARIGCESRSFSESTPSAIILSIRADIRAAHPGPLPEGLYIARLIASDPDNDIARFSIPRDLISRPFKIFLSSSGTGSLAISIEFISLDDVTSFCQKIPIGVFFILDIYNSGLNAK
jgi:hypothetical protein